MDHEFNEPSAQVEQGKIKCSACGGFLIYAPGTTELNCNYCGSKNEINIEKAQVEEIDFESFVSSHAEQEQQVKTVKCNGCGASTVLAQHITSDACSYCATPLVISEASLDSKIKPKYLLPFKIDRKTAEGSFKKWVSTLWFAPGDLTYLAQHSSAKLNGVYMPYWTFDSSTTAQYHGMRGTHYYVTETYTGSDGKTKSRQVRRTAWTPCSGTVHNNFDDVLVCASRALPETMTDELQPWDLSELVNYNDSFLSGFKTECYQIDVKEGFSTAKKTMNNLITTSIHRDIGGDEQRITSRTVTYFDSSFKHILLPLWISAYKYRNKTFRFTINARTGEVNGERPYSFWKIFFFILTILIVIAGVIYLSNRKT